jgi:predicted ferric reductase
MFSSRFLGFSTAQLVVMVGYAVLIGIGILLYSNPVTNAKRAGWIALSQLPVQFALAAKNNLVGLLVGKGYEKLNFLHRWVGRIMFIAILFHSSSFREWLCSSSVFRTGFPGFSIFSH